MPFLQCSGSMLTKSSLTSWVSSVFIVGGEDGFGQVNCHRLPHKLNRSSKIFKPCFPPGAAMSSSGVAVEGSGRSTKQQQQKHVVICGAGVIGSCTAFFLAQKGAKVTVVEKTGVACASSGKAGGFLALDWSDGSPLGSLARASFQLHAKLAEELDGASYGYRRVDTLSVAIEEDSRSPKGRGGVSVPPWIDGGVTKSIKPIGSTSTTAQVHPELFTKKVLSIALEKHGAELVTGEAQEVKIESEGGAPPRVKGVVVDGELISADCVVIAMGPWSATNSLISALTTISPLKAHSIVLRPKNGNAITPHALFLSYRTREGRAMDPEVYPRATGEVYICGMSEEVPLPADAAVIEPRKESIAMLQRVATNVSSQFVDAEVTTEQACFLPCSEDSLPLIGQIPDVDGAYVATGHSCWGILNAPATGASLAELIMDGASKTVNLKPFDPSRFSRTFASGRKLFR
ncbi:unnamed protein product [Calypogeia fissa]